jgi:CheY-like chemotaxis protein
MLRRLIGEDIEIVGKVGRGLRRVKVDPSLVEQVIVNLAVNARDAMPRGGTLVLETRDVELDEGYARLHAETRPGPYVMLAVSDTGHGMDEATLARMFEPFFTTKEPGKGTGLGLATVYGIVKQSGGSISAYSEPGRGTTFKVYLPSAEGEVEAASPTVTAAPPRGAETILLVEDEPALREVVREMLEEAGYTLLEASGLGDALDHMRSGGEKAHLLLTDVVLPGGSGRDIAERVREMKPDIRVLYMSGYTDGAIAHHGVIDEGVAFINKPFSGDALLRKVRQTLDARP